MRPSAPAYWLSARGVWALLGLAGVLAVASVVPTLYAAFAIALVSFAALVVADVALGPTRTTLRVARRSLPRIALRRTATLAYDVENRTQGAVRIGIVETPVPTIVFTAAERLASVDARSSATVSLAFHARERGRVRFGAPYVWAENRIGLLRRRYRAEATEDARVLPDLAAVRDAGTLAHRATLVDAGLRRLRSRGGGTEFESLREYLPGDAFRSVDWKATARRGRLTVAQYDVERSQQIVIALDCGRLMTPRIGSQRKFDYALTAALSVARVAQAADDRVGLIAFAARPLLDLAPRRGAAHVAALVRATFDLQPRFEEPDYETTFARLRATYTKRSLVVLFADIFDPVTSAAVLAGCASLASRHLVVCVLMNDTAIERALDVVPRTVRDAYRTGVAMTLADEREKAIALLRARGVVVVDVPAPKLDVALIDAYLAIKTSGAL